MGTIHPERSTQPQATPGFDKAKLFQHARRTGVAFEMAGNDRFASAREMRSKYGTAGLSRVAFSLRNRCQPIPKHTLFQTDNSGKAR